MLTRSADISDLPAILAIERASQAQPWSEKLFTSCFADGYRFLVAEKQGVIQAFLLLQETPFDSTIMNVAVAPEYRRRGLARALLKSELERLQKGNYEQLLLEVRVSNGSAIAFYEQFGFLQIGLRKGYYPAATGREDAAIYALKLS